MGARSDPDSEKDLTDVLTIYVSQSIPVSPLRTWSCSTALKVQHGLLSALLNQGFNDFKQRGVAVDKKRRFTFWLHASTAVRLSLSSPLQLAYGSLIFFMYLNDVV